MPPDIATIADIALINLPERTDRLDHALSELARCAGRLLEPGRDLRLIRPQRFDDAGGFLNPGYRSCLMAHLEAAESAGTETDRLLLVLEDDVTFEPRWPELQHRALAHLAEQPWHLANIGYEGPPVEEPDGNGMRWARFRGEVIGAQAYLVHPGFLPTWIAHLRAIATGSPGDDLRGPMGPDGALNTITWCDPSVVRMMAVPSMAGQRSFRSDITPSRYDRIPLARPALQALRSARYQLQQRQRRRPGPVVPADQLTTVDPS